MFNEIEQNKPYEALRISSNKPRKPIEPILFIDNLTVLSRGNISIVSAPPKGRKTFLMSAFACAIVSGNWFGKITTGISKLAWFDTEQAESDAGLVYDRVERMTGMKDSFDMFYLRGKEPQEMKEIINAYILQNESDFIIIDGIGDLCKNTNDIEEARVLKDWLMNITQDKNIHICCVLHVNYDSPKLRGHLGSELERKSEHVFLLARDGERSIVKPKLSRRKEYNEFWFDIVDGLPITDNVIPNKKFVPMQEVAPSYYETEIKENREFDFSIDKNELPF